MMSDEVKPTPTDPTEENLEAAFAAELAAEVTEEMASWAAEATEAEHAPEIKVTVRGALGRKWTPDLKVRTTLRSDGRVAVKVPPFPSHKETMPAFLIPNAMEPTSADVGTHRTVDELKVAKVKAIVKILVDAWIRIGVGRLKELMARRS